MVSIRDLLEGRWDYVDAGILDRTHLRFFTKSSLVEMFSAAGFCLEKIQGTLIQGCEVPKDVIDALCSSGIDTRSLEEEGKIYQYLLVTKPEKNICANIVNFKLTSIIILSYNQLAYTKKCIESIFAHTKEAFELIMVDNGSTDGTVEYLELGVDDRREPWLNPVSDEFDGTIQQGREHRSQMLGVRGQGSDTGGKWPQVRIKIIKNKENLGFAAGNNQGMAAARGDYVLLMNNDVVVTPGWLSRMVACAEKSPDIGMVGPVSNYVSGPQLVEGVDYDTHTLNGLIEFSNKFADDHAGQAQQILRVVGFCMLIKRAVIDKIGGMETVTGLGILKMMISV